MEKKKKPILGTSLWDDNLIISTFFCVKKVRKWTNNYLPSITARPIQPGGERSDAKGTNNVDDEMLPKIFNKCWVLQGIKRWGEWRRFKNGWVKHCNPSPKQLQELLHTQDAHQVRDFVGCVDDVLEIFQGNHE